MFEGVVDRGSAIVPLSGTLLGFVLAASAFPDAMSPSEDGFHSSSGPIGGGAT